MKVKLSFFSFGLLTLFLARALWFSIEPHYVKWACSKGARLGDGIIQVRNRLEDFALKPHFVSTNEVIFRLSRPGQTERAASCRIVLNEYRQVSLKASDDLYALKTP